MYGAILGDLAGFPFEYDFAPRLGSRAYRVSKTELSIARSALFSLESKNRFSFRARSKREMVLDLRRSSVANRPPACFYLESNSA